METKEELHGCSQGGLERVVGVSQEDEEDRDG